MKVLVIGDVCLDRWCTYDPSAAEPSRETGIPRTAVVSTEVTPGAAGTVANNLAALGVGQLAVLGVAGDDGFGYELVRALEGRGVGTGLLVRSARVPTFTYTKLINRDTGEEDRPRVDFIHTEPLPADLDRALGELFLREAAAFDALIVSDQAETSAGGVVTPALCGHICDFACRHPAKPVLVDSRKRIELYRDVIAKPNEDEAREACTRAGLVADDYPALRKVIGDRPMFVTLGPEGALALTNDGVTHVPGARIARPVDICGAGDSFSAGTAVALAAGADAVEAARFGNLAASITIMKRGTGTASPEEIRAAAAHFS